MRGPHGPSELAASVYRAPEPPCTACEFFHTCQSELKACMAFSYYVRSKPPEEKSDDPIRLYYFNQLKRCKPESKLKPGDPPNKPLIRHADDLPKRWWYKRIFDEHDEA